MEKYQRYRKHNNSKKYYLKVNILIENNKEPKEIYILENEIFIPVI